LYEDGYDLNNPEAVENISIQDESEHNIKR
jgi:hypothetical protein